MAQPNLSAMVHDLYSTVARDTVPKQYSREVAASFGYTTEALNAIPDGANLGLSCGNPTAVANLRPGEVVVDIGSGGGLDVFLAAKKVGPMGRAIGIDFSKDMIDLARRNAAKRGGYDNVRFKHASITSLPLPDASVDCVISNCVLNLVPDPQKQNVIAEIYRVLKPGGRVSISDIVARKPLPDQVRQDAASFVGCISGAVEIGIYRKMFRRACFQDVVFVDTKADINIYKSAAPGSKVCGCGSTSASRIGGLSRGLTLNYDINEYVGSFQIYALKSPISAK